MAAVNDAENNWSDLPTNTECHDVIEIPRGYYTAIVTGSEMSNTARPSCTVEEKAFEPMDDIPLQRIMFRLNRTYAVRILFSLSRALSTVQDAIPRLRITMSTIMGEAKFKRSDKHTRMITSLPRRFYKVEKYAGELEIRCQTSFSCCSLMDRRRTLDIFYYDEPRQNGERVTSDSHEAFLNHAERLLTAITDAREVRGTLSNFIKEVHDQQHQKKMLESERNSPKEQLAEFEPERFCAGEYASNNVASECATRVVSSLKEIWESCEGKLLSDEVRVQNEILDIAVLELEQMKITFDTRETLLESGQKTLFHLQKENEKLKWRLSLKVRPAVRTEDLELSDGEEQEKSSSSQVSYLVVDND
ncbi:hypothetical protein KIN20_033354 [Parelaphostrongylus tenuis]|uniref:Uncharacterized protein n=1 Tax=Parelaphostrongylus tenuis TaxID=148309 RepID=A0AAD5R8H0_PARTN|nr:hypothetical protein KIN20_033354 [Parelaphostrongylus tenuis]